MWDHLEPDVTGAHAGDGASLADRWRWAVGAERGRRPARERCAISRHERAELAAIEDALVREEPAFGALLAGEVASVAPVPRTTWRVRIAVALRRSWV